MVHLRCKSILLAAVLLFGSVELHAQKPPTDLTDLDIEEILSLHINRVDFERWHVGYRFMYASFDGYRSGTEDLEISEVLGPPSVVNPEDNGAYPITPTEISQQAHLIEMVYNVTQNISMSLQLPYIRQSSDHVSIPGIYENPTKLVDGEEYFRDFNITSSGLGDISVSGSYAHRLGGDARILASMGVNLPTGSIDKKGLTPRDPPNNTLLPFTMQIGSGTVDLVPTVAYSGRRDALRWSAYTSSVLRMGKNSRDYALGNRFALGGSISYRATQWVEPFVRLAYKTTGKIDGVDEDLKVPRPDGVLVFPAPVTNPDLYGGKEIELRLGSKVRVNKGLQERFALNVEYGLPVYQSLNGPQPKELGRIGLSATANF